MNLPKPVIIISGVGTAYGLTIILKDYFGGKRYTEDQDIYGKTAIVTGATRGIGKATATELAKRGGRVILACRDMKTCQTVRRDIIKQTFNKSVQCKHLDVGSLQSVREFAEEVKKEEKHLDILINNAGVMACAKHLSPDQFEWQLAVNFLGPFLLTNLLLDKLKEAPQGRIINLVSPIYQKGTINFEDLNSANDYHPKGAYGQSKLAMMLFSQELNRQLKGTNVTVNCANPGLTKTDIGRHLPMGQARISAGLLSPLMWVTLKTPYQGAQTSIYLAVDPDLGKTSGKLFAKSKEVSIDENALDEEVAKRLWKIAEKWTKLDS